MKPSHYILLGALLLLNSCQKVVEVRPVYPSPVMHCTAPEPFLGTWTSDSIHIRTVSDTSDSVWSNDYPTMVYRLQINCGSNTLFRLYYDSYATVRSEKVRSTNYVVNERGIYAFDAFESIADTLQATFVMRWMSHAPDRLHAVLEDRINGEQATKTDIFFRKDSN
jgi:hypothetical protein